jgi:hypothetical protein
MTKQQYLEWIAFRTPWTFCPFEPPKDWWDDEEFVNLYEGLWAPYFEFLANVKKSISKVGTIWCAPNYLNAFADSLTIEEQIQFFLDIRDYAAEIGRPYEFLDDIARAFPEVVERLPHYFGIGVPEPAQWNRLVMEMRLEELENGVDDFEYQIHGDEESSLEQQE